MLKTVCCTTIAALTFCASTTSRAEAPDAGHPILGTWSYSLPGKSCTEVYIYKSDGTTHITSGDEVAESEYTISKKPNENGFYEMTDKTVRDNGKPDCMGEATPVGATSKNFIQFHPSGKLMIVCENESLGSCFGPLKKVEGGG